MEDGDAEEKTGWAGEGKTMRLWALTLSAMRHDVPLCFATTDKDAWNETKAS